MAAGVVTGVSTAASGAPEWGMARGRPLAPRVRES